jgi:carboxylesterase
MHKPIWREKENAHCLIIFVHGFMGGPNQFSDLMEVAYERGYSGGAILLPGHGGTGPDFGRYSRVEWENHLQDELSKHVGSYQSIFLVGHSMGGLLALNASLQAQNRICGIFLLATPLKLSFGPHNLLRKASLLFLPRGHHIKEAYWQAKGFSGWRVSPRWLIPIRGFNQLMRKTSASLARINVPVLAIHSRYDETVSFKSADMLYKGLSNTVRKRLTLERSWHSYYPPDERELVRAAFVEFIAGYLKEEFHADES